MIISVDNRSDQSDHEVRRVIRAINRQIERDFEPHWDLGATVRLAANVTRTKAVDRDRRATVHLYHVPTGVSAATGWVFTHLPAKVEHTLPWLHWTVALSHEILELLADPDLNTLVRGPHPLVKSREVLHYREVCDPVQGDTYKIGGIAVSNFVLPHYYNGQGESGGENDFLRRGVKAFNWRPNGEIGFFDPSVGKRGKYVTFPQVSAKNVRARARKALVSTVKGSTGRLMRYAKHH
jgi:hypothetical protein